MKKILVKFSDERNKKYSIRTTIAENEETHQRIVIKENIYPEGKEHMQNILRYSEILKDAYPDVAICPVRPHHDGGICFDFISGTSMEEMYQQCVIKKDKTKMEALLETHKNIVLGAAENLCDFRVSSDFMKIFGFHNWNGSQKALKVANFDAIASNIIFQGDKPTFIDYEWVYEFPMPIELVIYHCVRDVYFHLKDLEGFYPLKNAMDYLKIETPIEEMEKAYNQFYSYVITQEDGTSYANRKNLNLMGIVNADGESTGGASSKEMVKMQMALAFAEKNWKEACQANALLSMQIQPLQLEAEKWKKLYEQECENHQIHAKQIEDAVQEQARQSEGWRIAYETVIHSRTWRVSQKLKRLLGRK